ncbi:MAG: hypothetical protein HF312_11015 [Ignavibacteria bacterium]|jgi:hypothetical protein|nr:hypothetical protein [Ignavibacteria bacterium]
MTKKNSPYNKAYSAKLSEALNKGFNRITLRQTREAALKEIRRVNNLSYEDLNRRMTI